MVLEFSNGGEDLEHVVLNNAAQAVSVFWQVALALAGACLFPWTNSLTGLEGPPKNIENGNHFIPKNIWA